jgi:hypothetical protein
MRAMAHSERYRLLAILIGGALQTLSHFGVDPPASSRSG